MGIVLKKKPLIEAILELKWSLPQEEQGMRSDPNYRLLLGRFSERVQESYPAYEQLPLAEIPDKLVAYQVQHRFRVAADKWPLLQLGPGLLTVNETEAYEWKDFRQRCLEAVSFLIAAYPGNDALQVQQLTLRYIDAVLFDFLQSDALAYLEDKLKATLRLPNNLFDNAPVNRYPSSTNWVVSFPLSKPEGTVTLKFATGYKNQQPAIVWETLVTSDAAQLPALDGQCAQWIDDAHQLADDWFFKLIDGELRKRFESD